MRKLGIDGSSLKNIFGVVKFTLVYESWMSMGSNHNSSIAGLLLHTILFPSLLPQLEQLLVLFQCALHFSLRAPSWCQAGSLLERCHVSPFFYSILVTKCLCFSFQYAAINFVAGLILTVYVGSRPKHIVHIINLHLVFHPVDVQGLVANFGVKLHNAHYLNFIDHLCKLVS